MGEYDDLLARLDHVGFNLDESNDEMGALADDAAAAIRVLVRRAEAAPYLTGLWAALDLVEALTDADECSYDHHGYCQTHRLDPAPCPHARAKTLLDTAEVRKLRATQHGTGT